MGAFGSGMLQIAGGAIAGVGAGYSDFVSEQAKFDKQMKLDDAKAIRAKDLEQYRMKGAESATIAAEKRSATEYDRRKRADIGYAVEGKKAGDKYATEQLISGIDMQIKQGIITPEVGDTMRSLAQQPGMTMEKIIGKKGKIDASVKSTIVKMMGDLYPDDPDKAVKEAARAIQGFEIMARTPGLLEKVGTYGGPEADPVQAGKDMVDQILSQATDLAQVTKDIEEIQDPEVKAYALSKLGAIQPAGGLKPSVPFMEDPENLQKLGGMLSKTLGPKSKPPPRMLDEQSGFLKGLRNR